MRINLQAQGLWSDIEPGGVDYSEDRLAVAAAIALSVPTLMVNMIGRKETTQELHCDRLQQHRSGSRWEKASTSFPSETQASPTTCDFSATRSTRRRSRSCSRWCLASLWRLPSPSRPSWTLPSSQWRRSRDASGQWSSGCRAEHPPSSAVQGGRPHSWPAQVRQGWCA